MILVDSRAGSNELARYIVPRHLVRISQRLSTDVLFMGWGPGGTRLEIGMEHKTLPDLLKCIGDGRFSGTQLEPLLKYDYHHLIVQGIWREGSDETGNQLEVRGAPIGRGAGWYNTAEMGWGSRVWRYAEVEHWLFTMQIMAGLRIERPSNYIQAGRLIGSWWRWWNDKAFEEHRSHLAQDKSHRASLRGELPFLVRMAAELPGVGPEAIAAIERHFPSARAAAIATPEQWAEIVVGGGRGADGKVKKPRRLGKKTAQRIDDAWEGRDE